MDNLINYDRTWKTVICLNPKHETITVETNHVGNIPCPKCGHLMVAIIRTPFDIINE